MLQGRIKKAVAFSLLAGVLGITVLAKPLFGQGADTSLYQAAEQLLAEKSYQLALEKYQLLASQPGLPVEQRREIAFKTADCSWRSGNAPLQETAEKSLKELVVSPEHDRWWAEANFSLAEYLLQKNQWNAQEDIKGLLLRAREFWAGYADAAVARPKFIVASFLLADHVTRHWGWMFETPNWGQTPQVEDRSLPPPNFAGPVGIKPLMEDVLKVADNPTDKARATYYLAMAYMNTYTEENQKSAVEYFQQIIKEYATSEWFDDAYYNLAQLHERKQDFPQALEMYRALLSRFRPGESQFVDNARERLKEITTPVLRPAVSYTFLPDSEIRFGLQWRNVKEADIRLYKLDLSEQLRLDQSRADSDYNRGINHYGELIKRIVDSRAYENLPVALGFHRSLKEEGKYLWYGEDKGLAEWQLNDEKQKPEPAKGILPPGAYLLMAQGGGTIGYELVIVSDTGLAVKTAGKSALFFAFDTKTGEPKAGVKVKYLYRYYNNNGNWIWDEGSGLTDNDGLLAASLNSSENRNYYNQHQLFAVASGETGSAFLQSNYYAYSQNKGENWLYAFADRPAYRPNEEISFKGILRRYDGSSFSTPAGMQVKAYLYDARNTKVLESVYTLNEFGSFAGSLKLDEKATLGAYRLELYTPDNNQQLATAELFRLEEYKLPEFLVSVKPRPKEEGQFANVYRLGDKVKVELDAQYYFGGPVANAKVEYLVYERPFYWQYFPPHQFPWFYADPQQYRNYYGNGTLVKKAEASTDAEGKAVFEIETDKTKGSDLTYRIEARVVDQSRREITASAEIKVTAKPYFIALTPKRNLYRPGDKAEVAIQTMTANNEPVAVEGKLSVVRNWWREGEPQPLPADAVGQEMPSIRDKAALLPEPHYEEQATINKFVKTDAGGKALFEFQPEQNGFYTVKFTGFDDDGKPVENTTNLYVCDKEARDIGLRFGGLQIIAESDTFRAGDTARLMLVTDKPGARVLLTAEAEEIEFARMVRMDGPVKLIELPVADTFVPNVFVTALSPADHQLRMHELELVVPPEHHFLNVQVTSSKEVYAPGEEGLFEVAVTNEQNQPVAAELGVSLVDASVFYIQSELAADIRQFFYGTKRNHSIQLQSSLFQRPYLKFTRNEKDALVQDERAGKKDRRASNAMEQDKGQVVDALKEEKSLSLGAGGNMAMDYDGQTAPSTAGYFRSDKAKSAEMAAPSPRKVGAERQLASSIAPAAPAENGEDLAVPQVRQDFRSTVFWGPMITTDAAGKASFKARFSDSLTSWRATARGISQATDVGSATCDVKTKKEIIVRLQAPRFFTERDRAFVSANVHNFTDIRQKIKVTLKAEGVRLEGQPESWVDIEPDGEKRVDWTVVCEHPGTADLTASAQTSSVSDAMQKSFPVVPHGIEKFIARALALKAASAEPGSVGEAHGEIVFEVPKERIPASTSLGLTLSPSMAGAMLDALPYLAEYPYGCVEQTMSRFLPAVIVAKTMRELGLSPRDVDDYIENVLTPRGDPQGHPKRKDDPTYSRLNEMTRASLNRLYDFQHSDGGWGWWKEGASDRFMTAYVVWGLALAHNAGLDIRIDVISRGARFLDQNLVEEEDNPDMLAWMLHALASAGTRSSFVDKQTARLWEMRDKLNPYTRALFALAQKLNGRKDEALILARNVVNGMQKDESNQTAHWGEAGLYYRWSEGGVEATAFSLKALVNILPESEFIAPVVKWLSLNRRGASWKNTRDTAIAILGLSDYLKMSGELKPNYGYEVFLNDRSIARGQVTTANMFTFDRYVDIPPEAIKDGRNKVRVVVNGSGALYVSAYLKYFTLEENITAAGNEIFVERKYFRQAQKETLLKGYVDDWKLLKDGDTLKSGDRVRVELDIEAKNNYEYLIFEDPKPAGLEAVELKSGSGEYEVLKKDAKPTGEKGWLYQEFRDQKAVFFVDKLKQGHYRIVYELRAEVPGDFHAMPDQGQAMYVPEIRANSSEGRIAVED